MNSLQDKKVIAFVGMPGSGKGTCTDYLHEKHHYPVVHFGNMMYEEVQRRGLDNVKDEKFVREDMRKKHGKAVLAKLVAQRADEHFAAGASVVVLDGLYSWSEYKYLEQKYGGQLLVIAVAAPRAERYKRILARTDSHRTYTSEAQIRSREVDEIENLEKGGPIAGADYTILNNQRREDLLASVEALLSQLGLSEM